MVKFSDLLFGKPEKLKQTPNYTPQQRDFMNLLLKQVQPGTEQGIDWLTSLFGDEGFDEYERPYIDQFEQQVIPRIMERFSGMGAKSSSGLNQALGQAGGQLSTGLAAQRSGLRNQAIGQLQNFSGIGLNQQNTPYKTSGSQGMFQQLLPLLIGMMA